MKTEKKVAAITGGYKGIGGALSELLAKKGYVLVLGGRNKEEPIESDNEEWSIVFRGDEK